jgi:Acetyltransferase (GNAT) domain
MDPLKGISESIGYNHPLYARSLQEFGNPRSLPHCGGWVLERPIPGTPYKDAMGCYPLFLCRDWSKIGEDLEAIKSEIVSIVLVTDPFSQASVKYCENRFDFVKPFKVHFITDLSVPVESFISKGHMEKVKKSLKQMEVEVCTEPTRHLEDWIRLYDNLIDRYDIRGIRRFSRKSFAVQLQIPGTLLFIGRKDGEIVGADLMIRQGDAAYAHLGAYSPTGYKVMASYGTVWTAIKYLGEHGVRYLDIGGVQGLLENPEGGLVRYKAGWSNVRATAYLCGKVLDAEMYASVCRRGNFTEGEYFPLYRAGEFS